MSLFNKGRIELPFPSVTTWCSAGELLIERIIFRKISNYSFCRPVCNRKMFATNDTSQACGFYHCISQQQNAKPNYHSRDVNSSLCCYSTTRLNPSLIAANSLTPKGSAISTRGSDKASSSCYCFPTLFTAAFHLTYQRLLSTQDVAK